MHSRHYSKKVVQSRTDSNLKQKKQPQHKMSALSTLSTVMQPEVAIPLDPKETLFPGTVPDMAELLGLKQEVLEKQQEVVFLKQLLQKYYNSQESEKGTFHKEDELNLVASLRTQVSSLQQKNSYLMSQVEIYQEGGDAGPFKLRDKQGEYVVQLEKQLRQEQLKAQIQKQMDHNIIQLILENESINGRYNQKVKDCELWRQKYMEASLAMQSPAPPPNYFQ